MTTTVMKNDDFCTNFEALLNCTLCFTNEQYLDMMSNFKDNSPMLLKLLWVAIFLCGASFLLVIGPCLHYILLAIKKKTETSLELQNLTSQEFQRVDHTTTRTEERTLPKHFVVVAKDFVVGISLLFCMVLMILVAKNVSSCMKTMGI